MLILWQLLIINNLYISKGFRDDKLYTKNERCENI